MLDLAYDRTIPASLLERMERAGKRLGLPLAALERLGSLEARCAAFVAAAQRDDRARMWALAGLPEPVLTPRRSETLRVHARGASN